LLGGPGTRPAAVDALAARTLVKGEALNPPAGRADDFSWPRREVGREPAKADAPNVANAAPGAAANPAAPAQPGVPGAVPNAALPQQKPPPAAKRPAQTNNPFGNFFGGGGGGFGGNPAPAPRAAPPPRQMNPGVPRPPAAVGRSAAVAQ
jgi:uncharacterized protein